MSREKLRLIEGTKLRELSDLQPEINTIMKLVMTAQEPVPLERARALARAWKRLGGFDKAERVLKKGTVGQVIDMCMRIQQTISHAEPSPYLSDQDVAKITDLPPAEAKRLLKALLPPHQKRRTQIIAKNHLTAWALKVAMLCAVHKSKPPTRAKARLRSVPRK